MICLMYVINTPAVFVTLPLMCVSIDRFCQWKILRMHLWRDHSIDTDLLECEQCDFKTDTVTRLETHMEIHQDAKPYDCDQCGRSFKQKRQLINHKIIHGDRSVENQRWYSNKQCDICKRVFANAKCLKIHTKVSHLFKPSICSSKS